MHMVLKSKFYENVILGCQQLEGNVIGIACLLLLLFFLRGKRLHVG